MIPPFMLRDAGLTVQYIALHNCPDYGNPDQNFIIFTDNDLFLDLEPVDNQYSLPIQLPRKDEVK